MNLPPDVPEPIRRWVASGHRNCRRQNPLPDIVDVVDAWVPMSIDRGERIEALEERTAELQARIEALEQPPDAAALGDELDRSAAAARAALDDLRDAVTALVGHELLDLSEQCPHLAGHRLEVVNCFDEPRR